MKFPKILLTAAVAVLFSAAFAFAEDAKKDEAAESKQARCCAKAAADGKACAHSCCTEAAAAGKNCEKCGGVGTAEAKK